MIAEGARTAGGLLEQGRASARVAPLLGPARDAVEKFAEQQQRVGNILEVFVPFVAQFQYVFRADNVRGALAPGCRRRIAPR